MNQDELDERFDRWKALQKRLQAQPCRVPENVRGALEAFLKSIRDPKTKKYLLKDNHQRKERKGRLAGALIREERQLVVKIEQSAERLRALRQALELLLAEMVVLGETERQLLTLIVNERTSDAARMLMIEMRFPGANDALRQARCIDDPPRRPVKITAWSKKR